MIESLKIKVKLNRNIMKATGTWGVSPESSLKDVCLTNSFERRLGYNLAEGGVKKLQEIRVMCMLAQS